MKTLQEILLCNNIADVYENPAAIKENSNNNSIQISKHTIGIYYEHWCNNPNEYKNKPLYFSFSYSIDNEFYGVEFGLWFDVYSNNNEGFDVKLSDETFIQYSSNIPFYLYLDKSIYAKFAYNAIEALREVLGKDINIDAKKLEKEIKYYLRTR